MANENRMRRTPQQVRGQRRVSKILDAAAEVFVETGYETATTNAIAIRANTSIGSLYQFFPNKRSILNALANRYRSQLKTLLEADKYQARAENLPLQQLLTMLIDDLVDFYADNAAFRPMFYVSQNSQTLSLIADELCSAIIERINRACSTAAPKLEPERCQFYASMIVLMMRAVIPLSQTQGTPNRELVIPHLKRMIFAYLASLDSFSAETFSFDNA